MTDLCANDALTLAGMLRRREVSAREVTTAHIDRIEALDGPVNAMVTRSFDQALHRPRLAGHRRPLRLPGGRLPADCSAPALLPGL